MIKISPPSHFKIEDSLAQIVQNFRNKAIQILNKTDHRIAIILGPCSIHNTDEAIEFGNKIRSLQEKIKSHFLLIMRVFFEKPRTCLGWKGFLYDPLLDGSNRLDLGLRKSCNLLRQLTELEIPLATEFLDPLAASYFHPYITWGIIGARTSASQIHRALASQYNFPIGFKNTVHGDLESPIYGIISSRQSQNRFTINSEGHVVYQITDGNPFAHLILRGSYSGPNCDFESIQKARTFLISKGLEDRLVIDCSHGNSRKKISGQIGAFQTAIAHLTKSHLPIHGLMLESNLFSGNQPIRSPLQYGISVTDPCLGWEETQELILKAHSQISLEPVQNLCG